MSTKRYKIETSCPQCGCSAVTHLSKEEIQERYGDIANVEMDCSECLIKYETDMKTACPEWDKDCKL
jgi:hypothetical protein